MENQFIKKNRTFTFVRKYGWLITVLIAIGGLWQPKLGLLVLFIMSGLMITSFLLEDIGVEIFVLMVACLIRYCFLLVK